MVMIAECRTMMQLQCSRAIPGFVLKKAERAELRVVLQAQSLRTLNRVRADSQTVHWALGSGLPSGGVLRAQQRGHSWAGVEFAKAATLPQANSTLPWNWDWNCNWNWNCPIWTRIWTFCIIHTPHQPLTYFQLSSSFNRSSCQLPVSFQNLLISAIMNSASYHS